MGYRYFDDQRLWDLTVEVFTRNGYSRSDCEDIANVLLASDRMGIESHGVQRMKLYTHSLEIGRIKPHTDIRGPIQSGILKMLSLIHI